jgi:hypothetical protein
LLNVTLKLFETHLAHVCVVKKSTLALIFTCSSDSLPTFREKEKTIKGSCAFSLQAWPDGAGLSKCAMPMNMSRDIKTCLGHHVSRAALAKAAFLLPDSTSCVDLGEEVAAAKTRSWST